MYIGFLNNGLWSFYKPQIGYKENFKYDKTYKDAEFVIITETELNININQFCVVTNTQNLTYNNDGTPLNHRQYIVKSFEKLHKNNNYWRLKVILKDVIEYFKGIQTTDIAFSNQVLKTVEVGGVDNIYTKNEYNFYTALNRILSIIPTNNDDLTILGNTSNSTSWKHRIELLDKDFLKSIYFNDNNLNASDLYNILFKFDDMLDRTPVAYFDIKVQGNNDLPVLNNYIDNFNILLDNSKLTTLLYLDFEFNKIGIPFSISGNAVTDGVELIDGGTMRYYYSVNNNILYRYKFKEITYSGDNAYAVFERWEYITNAVATTQLSDFNRPKFLLKFNRRDGFDKPEINFSDLTDNAINIAEMQGDDDFATGIVSEISNISPNIVTKYPSIQLWLAPQYDSDVRTINDSEEEQFGKWFLKTQTPIKRITKITKMNLYYDSLYSGTFERTTEIINNKYILENKEYLSSDYYADEDDIKLLYHFTEGENKIYINGYFWNDDKRTSIYYVEYETLINTSCKFGNDEYVISINQTDGQTDSIKYSQFLENYFKAMNKADYVITKIFTHIEDFENLIGSRVLNDNEEFMITSLSYVNSASKFLVSMQLNKDNFRRNLNVTANNQVLLNKSIAYDNLKDRKDSLKDSLKIGLTAVSNNLKIINNQKMLLLSALVPNQISNNTIQICLLKTYSNLYNSTGIDAKWNLYTTEFLITPIKQLNNKQIQYNLIIDSNALLGTQKDILANRSFEDIKYQVPVLYTDYFGEIEKFDVAFTYLDNNAYPDSTNLSEYTRSMYLFEFAKNYPSIKMGLFYEQLKTNILMEITNINEFKDVLEKFNKSYIFEVTSNDILICNALLKYSRLMQSSDTHTLKIFGFNTKQNENDLLTDNLFELSATSTYTSSAININFTGQDYSTLKSVVITTDSDEKLLIINNPNLTDVLNGSIEINY